MNFGIYTVFYSRINILLVGGGGGGRGGRRGGSVAVNTPGAAIVEGALGLAFAG
jgi:hypothetical protein